MQICSHFSLVVIYYEGWLFYALQAWRIVLQMLYTNVIIFKIGGICNEQNNFYEY